MMRNKDLVLGMDTSNYTTSVALTDKNSQVISEERILLNVKQGERGLRQSNALFQHNQNLPILLHRILNDSYRERIALISVSEKPRPTENSYMPVFLSGCQFGSALADGMGIPLRCFSHQEGHLKAASFNNEMRDETEYLSYHLSGGTCELLWVKDAKITVIGGSKDLSFGQLLDRLGVLLKIPFPCGKILDEIAVQYKQEKKTTQSALKKIPVTSTYFNVSGIETQVTRKIETGEAVESLICEVFEKITECLKEVTLSAVKMTNCNKILFSGGVSASCFLRSAMMQIGSENKWQATFGSREYSSDNAVGISLLGGQALWG